MSEDQKKIEMLEARIKQLEEHYRRHAINIPASNDHNLADDEWWAVFADYRDLTLGTIQKQQWQGSSNMVSTFKVKRIP